MDGPTLIPRSRSAGAALFRRLLGILHSPTFSSQPYWERRHRTLRGRLGAVGHARLSEAANAEQYAVKRDRLCRVLRRHSCDRRNLTLLDAGCGTGAMIPLYLELGFTVTGVDFSPTAVKQLQARGVEATFVVASIERLRLDQRFDFITVVDVLQHVVDDEAWLEALTSLERHLAGDGRLVILDCLSNDSNPAEHCRRRSRKAYAAALDSLYLQVVEHDRFLLEHENAMKDLLVVRRCG